jgi:hypothetical protein
MSGVYLPKPFQVISEIRNTKRDNSEDLFPVILTAKKVLRTLCTPYSDYSKSVFKQIKKDRIGRVKKRRLSFVKKK